VYASSKQSFENENASFDALGNSGVKQPVAIFLLQLFFHDLYKCPA